MRHLNKIVLGLALLLGVAFATPGCATGSQTPEQRADRVKSAVRLAVYVGAQTDIRANPQRLPAYESASRGLSSLVAQERWDVTALASAITDTGASEFQDEDTKFIILAGAQLVDVIVDTQRVDLANQLYARAVIEGAAAGLVMALKTQAIVWTRGTEVFTACAVDHGSERCPWIVQREMRANLFPVPITFAAN